MSWYGTIGHDVEFVVTRIAAVIASLSVVAIAWGEYYALPAVLLSAVLAYLVGRLLLLGDVVDGGYLDGTVTVLSLQPNQ